MSMAMSRLHPAGGKAAALRTLRALAPGEGAPRLRRQRRRQLTQGQGLSARAWTSRLTVSSWPARLHRWDGLLPHCGGRFHPDHVLQSAPGQTGPKLAVVAITGVG